MPAEQRMQEPTPTYDLKAALRAVLRRWWLIVALAAIGGGAAFAATKLRDDEYRTEAVLAFSAPAVSPQILYGIYTPPPAFGAEAEAPVTPSNPAAAYAAAAGRLGPEVSAGDVDATLEVRSDLDGRRITVIATSDDPEEGTRFANEFAQSFVALRERFDQQQIEEAIERAESGLEALPPELRGRPGGGEGPGNDLRLQIERLEALEQIGQPSSWVTTTAPVASEPEPKQVGRNTAAGAGAGALVGVVIALLPGLRRLGSWLRRRPGP